MSAARKSVPPKGAGAKREVAGRRARQADQGAERRRGIGAIPWHRRRDCRDKARVQTARGPDCRKPGRDRSAAQGWRTWRLRCAGATHGAAARRHRRAAAALLAELALIKGKKESAKEQANLQGELAKLAQKRISIEAAAERQQRELDAQAAEALEQRITGKQRDAQQAQESLRLAKLDTLEIGQTGAALGALRQARVEDTAAQLEAQARTMDGIDLSKRAGDALRAQAAAVREGAKVQGYNESARMVEDYARSVRKPAKPPSLNSRLRRCRSATARLRWSSTASLSS